MRELSRGEARNLVETVEIKRKDIPNSKTKFRILFVDSDPRVRLRLVPRMKLMLEEILGCNITVVSHLTGEKAWKAFAKKEFHMAILDGDSPSGAYGYRELYRLIKERRPSTPILLFGQRATLSGQDEMKVEAIYIYPIKPKDVEEIGSLFRRKVLLRIN